MTMQTGMVGEDGILIAGDTKVMNTYRGVRQSSTTSKVKISHKRGMVIASARNLENSNRIADDIIDLLKPEELEWPILPIEQIARNVLSLPGATERDDAQCLIVLAQPKLRLFFLQVGTVNKQRGPICQEIRDKVVAGDDTNAAVFWSEKYYERKPIRDLIPLAGHLVVSAGDLNPTAISGLEVVLCEPSGIHRLSDSSIAELELKSAQWDEEMRASFARYPHRLTYAPDVVS